ncbi:adenylate/guanylate cyclase domain-containing protein [Chelatococcus sp. SYSU_G07232]|uniref:Adenylate/guanylate cyclase domain-containing protein n=1 Tax=Chelatococcus albus TaxID=3047466 RepID=A0ABT7AK76_9HYPH|nr:adenylate/guanylate cyclase domain-containing protein [Chelatococcus sp. SYSU_G07232]MDJ1159219.1 adenylate/guanylate cyclase domain-containing protein [Chelatococcus sp. SYSU_G07232]
MSARPHLRGMTADMAAPVLDAGSSAGPLHHAGLGEGRGASPFDCPACASSYELARHLSPEALRASVALRDWLLNEARQSRDSVEILSGLCERLNAAGVPVDRASLTVETLHSEHAAVARLWVKGQGVRRHAYPYLPNARDSYTRSPFYHVHQTRTWLALWLPDTPDERFGIVPELKMMGYTHYLCFPVFFANGDENGISFTTKAAGGFSASDIALLHAIMPAVAAVMEISASYITLDHVLRIYIGNEPHERVLSGDVRRGQVSRIRSAILFADMRGYTRLTSTLAPEETVALLNRYFDCLVPPIEAEGGEILKYMGDGLLAIFRDRGDDTGAAAQSALTAAQNALARLAEENASGLLSVPLQAGIALHHGEAAYGNVGSGERLDFTVVGRDVNLTSRLARLNKTLDEPLLMSRAFADHLWADPEPLGAFALDGLAEEVAVYRPRRR